MTTSIRTRPKALRPKVIFSAVLAALGLGGLQAAHAQQIVGLTQDWQLVTFDSASPTFASAPVSISGLQFNEVLYGIDYRPSTGVLYGLGSFSNLYTLNVGTGAASFVASLTNAAGGGAYSLNANAAYGIDFNPVPDLGQALPSLRVTNSAGDNLRINVNAASAGQVSVDTALNPDTPSVGGSAYINNDTNPATGTALFNIDFAADTLLQQTNPNGGAISTIGALGVATSPLVGFDVGGNGVAYASLTNEITSKSSLYTVNLTTGAATLVGAFGIAGNTAIAAPLMDIAVTPVPEPSQLAMMLGGLVVLGGAASRRRTDR